MKNATIILLFLVSNQFIFAQETETYSISTDRPSVSYSASVVPKGVFQSEIGFVYTKSDQSNSSYLLPNLALRYGILKRVELRVLADYAIMEIGNGNSDLQIDGFLPVQIGTKISLIEYNGAVPKISVLGQMTLPKLASEPFEQEKASGFVKLLLENDLGNDFSLFYNLGADFADSNNGFSYSGGVSKSLNKLGLFAEFFGSIPEEGSKTTGIDGGISYTPNSKTQLDCAFGAGLNENSPDWFATIGFSFWLD